MPLKKVTLSQNHCKSIQNGLLCAGCGLLPESCGGHQGVPGMFFMLFVSSLVKLLFLVGVLSLHYMHVI